MESKLKLITIFIILLFCNGLWAFSLIEPQTSNLVLWLDANDTNSIVKDGSNLVSTINDKNGKGNHVSQTLADSKPVYIASILNSKGVIDFDGNDYLSALDDSTLNFGTGGFSVIAVFESDYDGLKEKW
jgi:hypothetical protein